MVLKMKLPFGFSLFAFMLVLLFLPEKILASQFIHVYDDKDFINAIAEVQPGQTILVTPGRYKGEISIKALTGAHDAWITIQGIDEYHKPIIYGGKVGLHLKDCRYVRLKNFIITDSEYNGVNIDDGGNYQYPAKNIIVENVHIYNIGGKGNRDGIKLSGVDLFSVIQCRIIGWGGSAIDMVGCHDGLITKSHFEGIRGFSQRNGVQAKGGSRNIIIQKSFFKNAGTHAVVIGGHTGKDYFRPKGINYEAKAIRASGNVIIGSRIPIAWGAAMGGDVTHNSIVYPEKAVVRIYQPMEDSKLIPCQSGLFANNLVVTGNKPIRMVKIEKGTLPKTFIFQQNVWYSPDIDIIRNLPVQETNGIYDIDPELRDIGNPQMRFISNAEALSHVGAQNYTAN